MSPNSEPCEAYLTDHRGSPIDARSSSAVGHRGGRMVPPGIVPHAGRLRGIRRRSQHTGAIDRVIGMGELMQVAARYSIDILGPLPE